VIKVSRLELYRLPRFSRLWTDGASLDPEVVKAPEPIAVDDGSEQCEIEQIIDCRIQKGVPRCKVPWAGWSADDDEWKTVDELDASALVDKSEEERAQKRKSRRRR
jgi:hypothetical protein